MIFCLDALPKIPYLGMIVATLTIKYIIMNKDKNVNPEERKENKSLEEKAINEKATDGKQVNPQVEQRKEKHQPRDNA